MEPKDVSAELWREYDFTGTNAAPRVYRIDKPVALYVGATCHRVVDADGIVHLVPAPGTSGCVVRWKNRNPDKPVNF